MLKKKIIKVCKFFTAILAAVFFPSVIQAGISVNEIMYDLPGSDDGREWAEIKNNGAAAVDLKDFRFFNKEGGHLIKTYGSASTVIEPGALVVFSDVPDKFLADWPNFAGILLDSSFSLVQSDTVGIKDESGNIIDSVSYDKSMGAAGDGNSLSRSGNTFTASSPTPGEANGGAAGAAPPQNGNASASTTTTSSQSAEAQTTTVWKAEPQIYAEAGPDRTAMTGVEVEFRGGAFGVKKEPLLNARHLWNFGDGAAKEGKLVLHGYKFPGRYIATLDVSSGEYSQGDSAVVTVTTPTLAIGEHKEGQDGFVEIKNGGERDVDISGIIIREAGGQFIFPRGTILAGKGSTKFADSITGLSSHQSLGLFYANGTEILNTAPRVPLSQTLNKQATASPTPAAEKTNTVNSFSEIAPAAVGQALAEENSSDNSSSGGNIWLFILAALVVAGAAAAAVFIQKKEIPNPADEYEIVD